MNANREEPTGKKKLVDTLLAIDSRMPSSSAEGREVAKEVLRRDRRRVRILTWATLGLFLLTVIGIYWNFHLANTQVMTSMWKCQETMFKYKAEGIELVTLTLLQDLYISEMKSIWVASVAVASLLAAAVCTVLLVIATRGATLRQIQSSLLALSEQFDTLRQSLQGGHCSGGGQATQKPNG
jgi:hypothetical protein